MTGLRRRLPPLGTLVAFESAARLGSFTRAANEIALSQASVSRQVRQLEADLGLRLFHRHRHDVSPTDAGRRLAAVTQTVLRELAATTDTLRNEAAGRRTYTIYTDLNLAGNLINPMLATLQQEFPERQFRVMSSFQPIEQSEDDFDLGFQVGRTAEDQFIVDSIADDLVFPVCSPAFLADLPAPLSPATLAQQRLLHVDYAGRDWPDWRRFLAYHRIREPRPEEGFVFTSYLVCLDMAARGAGIALGWALSVQGMIDEGRLVRIPGMALPFTDGICAYRPRLRQADPIAERIISLVRERVQPATPDSD